MIQSQTYLNAADNTGAQKLMCIKILGSNKKYAKVGDTIVAVVKERILLKYSLTYNFNNKFMISNIFLI